MSTQYKKKDEWKELFMDLSPDEFQDLCYDILVNNNFQNVKPRGKGPDKGRDFEAEFTFSIPGKEVITEKYWFQCKRYGKGTPLNYSKFSTEVMRSQNKGINRFIIVSNRDMTSDCKDDIEEWNKNNKCQISDWTGTKFLDVLFELPHICSIYFPDEEIPPIISPRNVKDVVTLSENLGNRFGIQLELNAKDIDFEDPSQIVNYLRKALLDLNVDINIKALIYEKMSLFFLGIGRIDDALLFIDKSLDITSTNINALINNGYILEKNDDLINSNNCYDDILEIDENNIFALNNKAHNLLRQGELDEALDLINHALDVNNNFILAIKNKTIILKRMKKFEEAFSFLKQNEEIFEKSMVLLTEEVDLCIEKYDLRRAYEINSRILEKNPNNKVALNNKGAIYERNAKYQNPEKYIPLAYSTFQDLIKKNENYPLGWSNLIVVLIISNRLQEAEEVIEEAQSKILKSHEVVNQKGIYFLIQNEPKKALKYFSQALNIWYKGDYLLNRAKAQYSLKQYDKANKDLDRLLKYEEENGEAWKLKGDCLKKLRRPFSKRCYSNAEKYWLVPISLLDDEE